MDITPKPNRPDRPDRTPDLVLPDNHKECEVSLWIEENLFSIKTTMSDYITNSIVKSSPCKSVEDYMEATLNHYPEDDPRCLAIIGYRFEQDLFKE